MHCARCVWSGWPTAPAGAPPRSLHPGHSVLIFTNTIEIKRITGNKKPKAAAVEL